jgi:O-antigen/teichoic acid export membrane protein
VRLVQRALMLAQFPERVILAGIGTVALPAFSDHARQGGSLKTAYLRALKYLTAVQWPALILLAIMAGPIVWLLYGPQWREATPVVQVFALALLFNFPTALNYPAQVAAGGIRHTVPLAFAQTTVLLVAVTFAAHYGILAVALSTFVAIPCGVVLSMFTTRAYIPFAWREFADSIAKSVVVTGLSAVGPLAVFAFQGAVGSPVLQISMSTVLGGIGWLAGLWLTRHPMYWELRNVAENVAKFAAARLAGVGWPVGRPR